MGISDFHRRLILLQVVLYRIVYRSNKDNRPKTVEGSPHFRRMLLSSLHIRARAPQYCRGNQMQLRHLWRMQFLINKLFFRGPARNLIFFDSLLVRRLFDIEETRQERRSETRRWIGAHRPSGSRPSAWCVVRLGTRPCNAKNTAHSSSTNRQADALPSGRHQSDRSIRIHFGKLESER